MRQVQDRDRLLIVLVIMAMWAAFIAVMALSAGCGSLLKIEKTEKTPIPLEPRPAPDMEEAARQQAAYAADVLAAVYALGARARDAAVDQAHRAAAFVESFLGGPQARLAVQVAAPIAADGSPSLAPNGGFEAALKRAESALQKYRKAIAAHAAELDRLRSQQMGMSAGTSITSPWLSWIGSLGWAAVPLALLVLFLIAPKQAVWGLICAVWNALKAIVGELVLRATRGLQQVVEGIEKAKAKMDPASLDVLKQELVASTTPATRKAIAVIQETVKDKLRQAPPEEAPAPSAPEKT
jgi:ABC-type multidrug transport system fused ATPase/permease subunit